MVARFFGTVRRGKMLTGLNVESMYAFLMDNWIIVAIIAVIVIQIVKKMMRLTKRALYLMYSLSGGFAGLGFIKDIIEQLMDK